MAQKQENPKKERVSCLYISKEEVEKNENKIFLFFIRIMVERKKEIIGNSIISLTKKCLNEKNPLLEDMYHKY